MAWYVVGARGPPGGTIGGGGRAGGGTGGVGGDDGGNGVDGGSGGGDGGGGGGEGVGMGGGVGGVGGDGGGGGSGGGENSANSATPVRASCMGVHALGLATRGRVPTHVANRSMVSLSETNEHEMTSKASPHSPDGAMRPCA